MTSSTVGIEINVTQSHQQGLEEQYDSLPLEMQMTIEDIVSDVIDSLEEEGFRVTHVQPAKKLSLAVMQYIYDTETMLLDAKQPLTLPPLISIKAGCC